MPPVVAEVEPPELAAVPVELPLLARVPEPVLPELPPFELLEVELAAVVAPLPVVPREEEPLPAD